MCVIKAFKIYLRKITGLLAVSKIRQMYPEPSGQYVGFKRTKDDEETRRKKKGRPAK